MTAEITSWLTARLPQDWYAAAADITVDRDEILVVGELSGVDAADPAAVDGRIARFREETRADRMKVSREAEQRYGRVIAWGARVGETTRLFTTHSVPVMTRLRQPERIVLDTLVEAGVARSRSDALAWCVRLVGRNADAWLAQLSDAMTEVRRVREQGPSPQE
jgi:hypothetical protein